MLGYLRQIVGSSGEAEDIVQVAFLKLFDQLQKGAELQETRSWLYRVAHNLAIDSLRRQGREESAAIEWMAQRELEDAAVSMEDNMSRRQQVDLLMHGLNERERHCLLLRAEGLSYKEIANVLTISVKAVSVYLSRGLKKFDQKK